MAAIARATDPFVTRWVSPEKHRLTPAAIHILSLERRADIGKARRELGYEPTSIRAAIEEAYDWFCERGLIHREQRSGGTANGVSRKEATA
jgi:nucleoside-diphosphate-sugar epimerase